MLNENLQEELNKINDSSFKDNILMLNKICGLLSEEKKEPFSVCGYLMKNSIRVKKLVETIVNSGVNLKEMYGNSLDNEYFNCFIEMYCAENNISLFQDDKSDDVEYDKYYESVLNEIPLLTLEEETKLFDLIKNGSENEKRTARHALIKSNLRLVRSVALKYSQHDKSLYDDLMQEGTLGLFSAVEKFDGSKGIKFSTYAYFWIKQRINRANKKQSSLLTLSTAFSDKIATYQSIVREFYNKTGEEPSLSYILDKTGYDKKTIAMIENNVNGPISINSSLKEYDDLTVGDSIADEKVVIDEAFEIQDLSSIIMEIFDTVHLNDRDYKIICYRFGLFGYPELTLEQVAKKYNVTRERIRQIEKRILKNIKKNTLCNERLSGYYKKQH